jgi:hypothetical protein
MQAAPPATEIRLLAAEDSAELAHLAELDTAKPPLQPLLGATVNGRLIAAHSLATDESIADPFSPTAGIRSLLARRARQLRGDGRHRGLLGSVRRRLGGEVAGRQGTASEPIR